MHSNLFWGLEFPSKQQRWLISASREFLFSPWNSQLMRKCTSSSVFLELQNWHNLLVGGIGGRTCSMWSLWELTLNLVESSLVVPRYHQTSKKKTSSCVVNKGTWTFPWRVASELSETINRGFINSKSVTVYRMGCHQEPLLLTWFNSNPSMTKIITCAVKCGMKLLIHFQTSTVVPWTLGWISNFIPRFIVHYLPMLVFKLIHVSKRGPKGPFYTQD